MVADDRSMHPQRVVGKRPAPPYDGPDLLKPQVTVGGKTGNVPDLNWLKSNARNATSVKLERSPQPGVEAVLKVEGADAKMGPFSFQSGFRDRNQARLWADTHLAHVQDRENGLRDGGY